MTDGVYLAPVDLDEINFPTEEIPFLRNDVQFADFFNLMFECINALRLCGSVTVPTPQGEQDPSGMYPRPLTRTEINFPTDPLPYFGNQTQQGRIRNFFVDALNALRRCYLSASPTEQGTSIDAAVYLPPPTIASIGFPDNPIPTNLFGNHVQGKRLYDYLVDALNILRNCCATCANDASGTVASSGLSPTKARGDDFSAWPIGTAGYDSFLQDTVTNPNYEDSSRLTSATEPGSVWSDEHMPADLNGYFWQHFDDTDIPYPYHPPVGQPNRNRISQVDVNGGHRSVKAIKTSDDMPSLFHGFEIWGQDSHSNVVGGTVVYTSLWARLVYKYSANYPLIGSPAVRDGSLGTYLIDLQGGSGAHDCTIATGTLNFSAAKLTIGHKATPNTSPNTFEVPLGDTVDMVLANVPQELFVYCGTAWDEFGVAKPNIYRVAVWWATAFGTRYKMYDVEKPTTVGFSINQIVFMRPKAGPDLVPAGETAICYECLEWEYEPGSFGADPYAVNGAAWNPAGQSPPVNDSFAGRTVLAGASGSLAISEFNVARAQNEVGEPHRFNGSLWYEWTAPANGTAVFDTIGSDPTVDTYLGIYTGVAVGALVQITVDDDSGGGLSSLATFAAVSGTVYKIQVSRRTVDTGPILLNWSLT